MGLISHRKIGRLGLGRVGGKRIIRMFLDLVGLGGRKCRME